MNYQRIYAEFIKSRRIMETAIEGYSESHHIVPRCLGGGDESENKIDLTAEDHFFAHLLLAKIHGGKLWAPVAFMVGGTRKDYKPIFSRTQYGWASRAMAKAASGQNAHQYDWTEFELVHRDGRSWRGNQGQMHEALGMGKPLANMLVKGRVRTALGWYMAGTRPRFRGADFAGANHMMYRATQVSFCHVDGRTFTGTQHEFHLAHKVSKSAASCLVRGKCTIANGWYVDGQAPTKKGRGARWLKSCNQGRPQHSVD